MDWLCLIFCSGICMVLATIWEVADIIIRRVK